MNAYLALMIPLIAGIFLILFFKHKVTWWEMFLPMLASLILIFSMDGCMRSSNCSDTEYISNPVVRAVYEEPWNEYIHKTCSRTTCTGSGKSRTCHTTYYDCSYVQYHEAKWYIVDGGGYTYSISRAYFEELCRKWDNRTFVDLNRHFHTIDGDEYITQWNTLLSTLLTTHRASDYENRVQASHSIYDFDEVTDTQKVQYGLYDYPAINNWKQDAVIGMFISPDDQDYVNTVNARLGSSKQLHMYICVFKDKTIKSAEMQRMLWKNGNKNEFIICVGMDSNFKITWAYPFTWSEKEICKIKVRNYLNALKGRVFEPKKLADFSYGVLSEDFVRKEFKDFEYLQVDLTDNQVDWIYIITILLTIGISIFVVVNDFEQEYVAHIVVKGRRPKNMREAYYMALDWMVRTKIKTKTNVNRWISKVLRKR